MPHFITIQFTNVLFFCVRSKFPFLKIFQSFLGSIKITQTTEGAFGF